MSWISFYYRLHTGVMGSTEEENSAEDILDAIKLAVSIFKVQDTNYK